MLCPEAFSLSSCRYEGGGCEGGGVRGGCEGGGCEGGGEGMRGRMQGL